MENNFIKIHKWLYPVSWLYGAGVWIRNRLFDWGIYKEKSFDIPVQLRTSEHRSMYSYVRLSIDRCTATYV